MGSVSIADLERVALGGSSLRMEDDIGNVIDLDDDLGLSMLSNPSKVSVQKPSSGDYGQGRTMSISSFAPPSSSYGGSGGSGGGGGSGGSGGNAFSGIDVTPLEPMEPISFSKIDSGPIDVNTYGGQPVNIQAMQDATDSMFGNFQSATGPGVQLLSPARDPEAEKKEKSEYLNKLQRLEAKGFPVARKFTMDNALEEIKTEYFRLVDARQLETSVKFQRQMLMGAITGMEWLNGRFDPFDLKLEGWSESVHENVEDFDEIFEELYDKYKDRGKMSPEMRLIMAVGGSGFMCHVSNTFFRSKMPSMDDVLRRNPELAKQMAAAAAQQAGPGFGNFMGMAMGLQPGGPGPAAGNGGPPTPSTGAFFGASAATPVGPGDRMPQQQQQQTARREMSGPSGVDDILKTFEEIRRAEASEMSRSQPANGFATQPAVAAATSGAASIVSADELGSTMTGATGSLGAGGGRRRRRAQPPVGSTISLNV